MSRPETQQPTRRPARGERGAVTVLIVGFAVLLLMAVAAVVDVSAAFLRRQSLDSLADGAALRGADLGAQGSEVYAGGLDDRPLVLTADAARAGVRGYLRDVGAYRDYPGLTYTVRVQDDRVLVHLASSVDLPLSVPGGPDSARVSATGSAVVAPG